MRDIEDYAEKYVSEPCEKYQVLYRRKQLLQIMERYSHKNILEIGCGLEPLFPYIEDFEREVIVEPAGMFIEVMRQKIEQCRMQDKVCCIEGFFEDEADRVKKTGVEFDYIIVSSLLHEVEQPEKLMMAVKETCGQNTIVHINVPNANSLHRLLAKEMGLISDVHELSDLQIKMQRNSVYDIDSLSEFVKDIGFEVLESGSYLPKFFTAGQMEQILQNGILTEEVFEGLYGLGKYLPDYGSEIYVQLRKKE